MEALIKDIRYGLRSLAHRRERLRLRRLIYGRPLAFRDDLT